MMKQELTNQISPIVNNFIDKLIEFENRLKQKEQELCNEIEKSKKYQDELKIQKSENDYHLKISKDKLTEEQAKQSDLNNQIKDEIAKYNKLNSELNQKLTAVNENLENSKIEKDLISKSLEETKKKENDYLAKLHFLKTDLDDIIRMKAELQNKEKQFTIKEKLFNKRNDELIEKENQQNYLDTELKVREAEVSRLIKRYKLEESLKVK